MASEENAGRAENAADESTITMVDFLEQQKEIDEEYAAVLGASDEKCCTYDQGAVKRQALYSCLTCCPESRSNLSACAGVCLACSLRCHENHELVELYTKRNFRCDCPTKRLGNNKCILNPQNVKEFNVDNAYNQNFQGLYCNCKRPYPDPERASEEVMLQCGICEDWFHLQHLDVPATADKLMEESIEMICNGCMSVHTFLQDYTGLALKVLGDVEDDTAEKGDVSVCDDNDNKLHSDLDKSISEIMNMGEAAAEQQDVDNAATTSNANESDEPPAKRQKMDNDKEKEDPVGACSKMKEEDKCRRPTGRNQYDKGATFWNADWRASLCKCSNCLLLYKKENVEFLLDTEDSAKSYEERGIKRAGSDSTYEQGIRALATMDRTKQIDAITEYNRMKEKLMEYLQPFVASNKVVTEDDINRFFAQMRSENAAQVGLPHFCR